MTKEELKEAKKNLIEAIVKLDLCWGHHQDGSDLYADKSRLFNVMINEVPWKLREIIRKIQKELGITMENPDWNCDSCGLPRKYGGPCGECGDIRQIEEDKINEERKKI